MKAHMRTKRSRWRRSATPNQRPRIASRLAVAATVLASPDAWR